MLDMRASIVKTGITCVCIAILGGAWWVSLASAEAPSWTAQANFLPTDLVPGQAAKLEVLAINLGDAGVSSATVPVKFTDMLPAGVRATGVGFAYAGEFSRGFMSCEPAAPATSFPARGVTCTWAHPQPLEPYEALYAEIRIEAEPGVSSGRLQNEVSVSGGEGYLCHRAATPGTGNFRQANCSPSEEGVTTDGEYEGEASKLPVPAFSQKEPLIIGAGGATPFGLADYRLALEGEGGTPAVQAGSHPYQLTTTLALNQGESAEAPPALVKDITSNWPAGLVGNATTIPQCAESLFDESNTSNNGDNECPGDTAIGVAIVHFKPIEGFTFTLTVPLFNLPPAPGEPARAGFVVQKVPNTVDTSVRTGGDYGVVATSHNISEAQGLVSATIVVWGTPGDPSHDRARGWNCIDGGFHRTENAPLCAALGEAQPVPFLSLPTSCTGPLQSTAEADSWQEPHHAIAAPLDEPMAGLGGCNSVPFDPSMSVAPDVTSASTPTGLTVRVHVPQEGSVQAGQLLDADVQNITVPLPEGMQLNPSVGDGVQGCTGDPGALPAGALGSPGDEIGYEGEREVDPGFKTMAFTGQVPNALALGQGVEFCPNAAKVANVAIKSPLLPNELKGAVYLATQNSNPFGSLVALYLVAEDPVSGTLVKLPGEVRLSPAGQVTTVFANTPQLPFEEAKLEFFGGERAPLATPAHCGSYTTNALLTPWTSSTPVSAPSTFDITSGPNGGPCPGAQLPFGPSLTSGTSSNNGGALSPLTTTIARGDGQQNLQAVTLRYPPGVSGLLPGVELCREPQANEGSCSANSLVGETTVSAGVGSDPVSVQGGRVYLTGPYNGSGSCTTGTPGCAPFGLSIASPVKAGPFDLEHDTANPSQQPGCDCVVVRAKIEVDPHTAALTIITNPSGPYAIPRVIDGVPVQLQKVNVLVNRPSFTFNPTNCGPLKITGAVAGAENASAPVEVPFQAANCASLPFHPGFKVATQARASKQSGASLGVTVASSMGQANIAKVAVSLPKQLPARLTTIQQACTEQAFAANPASCPAGSDIGTATAKTPVLSSPLVGPAYLVSHGGAAFPDLVIILQGEGVTLDLVGSINIKKGITSSAFESVPDAPISSFQLSLPEGPHSGLAANLPAKAKNDFCGQSLTMPTTITGQNGAQITQKTKVTVSGCPKTKAKKKKAKPKKGHRRKKR
jgi:hypothetical protein